MEESEEFCKNCKRNISAANFASHSAFCERNIKVCKICNEPVPVAEEKEHLEEYHIVIACKLCEAPLEKWLLPKHEEICPKRKVPCKFCEADVSFDEFEEHYEFCGSRTEKCVLCQRYIMYKDKKTHTEFHKKSLQKGIEEVQNVTNKVISKSGAPRQNVSEKLFKSDNDISSYENNKDTISKHDHLEDSVLVGATASVPDKAREISKHYTTCYICKQSVSWIDFNTHLPACATESGKCSRCGDAVASHEMKDHVLRTCRMLPERSSLALKRCDTRFPSQDDLAEEDQRIEICSYCKQPCSADRILEHVRSCIERVHQCELCSEKFLERDSTKHASECKVLHPKNFSEMYECPLCGEELFEPDKMAHESFSCRLLMEINEQETRYAMSYEEMSVKSSKQKREELSELCPSCHDRIPYDKITEHKMSCPAIQRSPCIYCEELILVAMEDQHLSYCKKFKETSKSYADATRKSAHKDYSEVCVQCKNTIPKHEMSDHEKICHKKSKFPCRYCDDMVLSGTEEIHLASCKAFVLYSHQKTVGGKQLERNSYGYKGAVPKHSNFQDIVKPRTAKCKFCKTTLNADIVIYHENECVQQPVKCKECYGEIILKDWNAHKCKVKKDKQRTKGNQKKEDKTGGWLQKGLQFFGGKSDTKTHDQYENERNELLESYNQNKLPQQCISNPQQDISNESLYFSQPFMDDTKIPCEFCNKLFSVADIVLHETGCNPTEVSYAKKVPSEDVKETTENKKSYDSSVSVETSFFASERNFLPTTKYETIKKHLDNETKPGEFLNTYKTSEPEVLIGEYQSAKKDFKHATFQSVWNHPSDVEMKEVDSANSFDSTEKMSHDLNEKEKIFSSKIEKCSIDSDEEVSNMISFINEDEDVESCGAKNERSMKLTFSKWEKSASDMINEHNMPFKSHYQKDFSMLKGKDVNTKSGEKNYKNPSKSIHNFSEKDLVQEEEIKQKLSNFKFGSESSRNISTGDNKDHVSLAKDNDKKLVLKLHTESSLSNKVIDDKESEGEMPFKKAFEYILNATAKNSDQNTQISKQSSNIKSSNDEPENLPSDDVYANEFEDDNLQCKEPVSGYTAAFQGDRSRLKVDTKNRNTADFSVQSDMSIKFTDCPECGQTIAWTDYPTHVPICASNFVTCLLCNEKMPSSEKGEHISRKCPRLCKRIEQMKNLEDIESRNLYEKTIKSLSQTSCDKKELKKHSSKSRYVNNGVKGSFNVEKMDCAESSKSGNVSNQKKAFTIEPDEKYRHLLKGNNEKEYDEKLQIKNSMVSHKSHVVTTDVDIAKWAKWRK